MLVFNALNKKVSVQVAGNWFEFGPEQVKLIHNEDIGFIMTTRKAYEGLVAVPDVVGENRNSPEAKKALEEARIAGISNRVQHLKGIVQNLEVSLKRDLKMKNMDIDVDTFASDGELAAYRELVSLKDVSSAKDNKKAEELKTLREKAE